MKVNAAQRQPPAGTPKGVAERDRELSINGRIQDLVNQSFPATKYLFLFTDFGTRRTLFVNFLAKS
jgi:hypothetical protein